MEVFQGLAKEVGGKEVCVENSRHPPPVMRNNWLDGRSCRVLLDSFTQVLMESIILNILTGHRIGLLLENQRSILEERTKCWCSRYLPPC